MRVVWSGLSSTTPEPHGPARAGACMAASDNTPPPIDRLSRGHPARWRAGAPRRCGGPVVASCVIMLRHRASLPLGALGRALRYGLSKSLVVDWNRQEQFSCREAESGVLSIACGAAGMGPVNFSDISGDRRRDAAACHVQPFHGRLSMCMIARDSARTLRAALDSIRPFVDEMVVVDTGSVDDTPAIAAACGARVAHFAWCDDFAAARNELLRLAGGEWLFWMDSDDTIDAANGRALRALADAAHPPSVLGFIMQVACPAGDDGRRVALGGGGGPREAGAQRQAAALHRPHPRANPAGDPEGGRRGPLDRHRGAALGCGLFGGGAPPQARAGPASAAAGTGRAPGRQLRAVQSRDDAAGCRRGRARRCCNCAAAWC